MTQTKSPSHINILGTPVHVVGRQQTLAWVNWAMTQPDLRQIATTNPEFVMTAQQDADFHRVLWQADLCIPDGIGLIWASRWLKRPLPERVPGSELVYLLAEQAAQNGWRLYLLGAAPGVAAEAATIFQTKYPGLIIAGTYAGSPAPEENDEIVARITNSRADLLFVAYGAPRQDKWIARNRHNLPTVRVAIGVGGSLDFVTGKSIRAPRWLQRLGLEWLHRLYHEPWRWRRMLSLPRFVWQVAWWRGSEVAK